MLLYLLFTVISSWLLHTVQNNCASVWGVCECVKKWLRLLFVCFWGDCVYCVWCGAYQQNTSCLCACDDSTSTCKVHQSILKTWYTYNMLSTFCEEHTTHNKTDTHSLTCFEAMQCFNDFEEFYVSNTPFNAVLCFKNRPFTAWVSFKDIIVQTYQLY